MDNASTVYISNNCASSPLTNISAYKTRQDAHFIRLEWNHDSLSFQAICAPCTFRHAGVTSLEHYCPFYDQNLKESLARSFFGAYTCIQKKANNSIAGIWLYVCSHVIVRCKWRKKSSNCCYWIYNLLLLLLGEYTLIEKRLFFVCKSLENTKMAKIINLINWYL